jgi:RNA polymerase sigma-70 factor (ECF subfamily)
VWAIGFSREGTRSRFDFLKQEDSMDRASRPESDPALGTTADQPRGGLQPGRIIERIEAFRKYLLKIAHRRINPDFYARGGPSDLVQETLAEANRDAHQFHGETEAELKGWLRKILRNNLANFARRHRADRRGVGREIPLDRSTPDGMTPINLQAPGPTPSGVAEDHELAEAVKAAVARLPERDQQLIHWRHHDDLGFEAIGQLLGESADTARKAYGRAVLKLQAELGLPPGHAGAADPSPPKA